MHPLSTATARVFDERMISHLYKSSRMTECCLDTYRLGAVSHCGQPRGLEQSLA